MKFSSKRSSLSNKYLSSYPRSRLYGPIKLRGRGGYFTDKLNQGLRWVKENPLRSSGMAAALAAASYFGLSNERSVDLNTVGIRNAALDYAQRALPSYLSSLRPRPQFRRRNK